MFELNKAKAGVSAEGEVFLEFVTEGAEHGSHLYSLPLEAVASWSELLGYDNAADALEAILFVAQNGEPDPDPETGDNVWTEPYIALGLREQARERAAIDALKEGKRDNPQSVLLRSSMAANKVSISTEVAAAVTQGGDAGSLPLRTVDNFLPNVQAAARARLALPRGNPRPKSIRGGTVGRASFATLGEEDTRGGLGCCSPEERQELEFLLLGHEGEIGELRRRFCHSLSGFDKDPLEGLEPELDQSVMAALAEEQPERSPATRESLLAKYGGVT